MAANWNGDVSQEALMQSDQCILLDFDDRVTGHASKAEAHTFNAAQPRGLCHRAFSVFLFDLEGRLLLQQRAADKITFPNVWTNTCCSHPLFPDENDDEDSLKTTTLHGVKSAAIRKLVHELGIKKSELPISKFKFLTRLHYWAADVVTHGEDSPWGEHEIDYILFIQTKVSLKPNPEEVQATRYVSQDELSKMMLPDTGLLWSPWFRIIAEKFLPKWWENLRTTLTTDTFVDVETIHRFDPSPEHMGGRGKAGPLLGSAEYHPTSNGDKGLKQGAYGKVKIHKHSTFDQLSRVDEVFAALWFKFGASLPNKLTSSDDSMVFCDDMLGKVSRSFAAVIRQLPKGLCVDILVFYLVLRALDTIEDDMEAFKGREHVKIQHLQTFYQVLGKEGWNMEGVGAGDERVLLEKYYHCVNVYNRLPKASQEVIADIAKRMGEGMASFVAIDLGQGTVTVENYNQYCHYVAGLVGEGLSRLFTCCGYESQKVADSCTTLANTMGLFLQKTNIIRDYLEDYVDGRAFWPQEIWKKYSKTGDLGDFAKPENVKSAVECLNDLITDALECVPECLEYMNLLKTEEVFRFCAIPQVMAIATLADLYNNPDVFTGVVKIRKGMAAKLILDTKTKDGLYKWFYYFAKDIRSRIPNSDPNASATKEICDEIISTTEEIGTQAIALSYGLVVNSFCPVAIVFSAHYLAKNSYRGGGLVFLSDPESLTHGDLLAAALFLFSVFYVLLYSVLASKREKMKRADP